MSTPSEPSYPPQMLPSEHHAHILVAEDPYINSFLRAVLKRKGHSVITGEAYESSDLLDAGRMHADIVITNAPQAFLAFADRLPVLYIAANPDLEMAARFHTCRVLSKPFRNSDLLQAVDELAHAGIP